MLTPRRSYESTGYGNASGSDATHTDDGSGLFSQPASPPSSDTEPVDDSAPSDPTEELSQ